MARVAAKPADVERTVWWRTADPPPPTSPLSGSAEAEVAVIGAGFTGLTAALHLAQRGAQVVLLEADRIGAGASGVNAGFVVPSFSRIGPAGVLGKLGPERGRRLLQLVGTGADRVFETVREFRISCDAAQVGWLHPAPSEPGAAALRELAAVWAGLGRPVSFLDRAGIEALTGMRIYHGALLDHSGGTIHPLNYARGLARAVQSLGVAVHERSPVLSASREGAVWLLRTPSGTVRAGKVLLCTNAFQLGIARRMGRTIVPLSVSQIATERMPPEIVQRIAPNRQPVSDSRANLFTYRLDRDDRLISAGMAVFPFGGRRRLARSIAERLGRELDLPSPPLVEFAWRGTAAMTPDGLPHLYELGPGFIGGIGCNGRGIAMTAMLGEVLADAAMGADLQDLAVPLAAPQPIPFRPLAPLVASGAILQARFRDWRERTFSSS